MKKPTVAIHSPKDVARVAEKIEDFRQSTNQVNSPELTVELLSIHKPYLRGDQRRSLSRNKQPTLPSLPIKLFNSRKNRAVESFTTHVKDIKTTAQYILAYQDRDDVYVSVPNRLPDNCLLITMVLRPLPSGESVYESYYIGSNRKDMHWYLIICEGGNSTLSSTGFFEAWTTSLLEKSNIKIEEAAILLLECAWRSERFFYGAESIYFVNENGLLHEDIIMEIAERVWPTEGKDESFK